MHFAVYHVGNPVQESVQVIGIEVTLQIVQGLSLLPQHDHPGGVRLDVHLVGHTAMFSAGLGGQLLGQCHGAVESP